MGIGLGFNKLNGLLSFFENGLKKNNIFFILIDLIKFYTVNFYHISIYL